MNKPILVFLLSIFSFYLSSQNNNLLNRYLIQQVFNENKDTTVQYKSFQKKNSQTSIIIFYQKFISEQIQANCIYETSCSEYTKQQILKNGFLNGLLSGFNQWFSCNPIVFFDFPPSAINEHFKIINNQ